MPAPIDWTAAGGIDSVKQLTINHGPREAARLLNLSAAHSEALRRRCSREGWMDAVRPTPPPVPASMLQPVQRMSPPSVPSDSMSPAVQSGRVPAVPTAAQAAAEANAENGARSRSAALRYSARNLEHLADLDPEEGVLLAPQAASLVKVAATAGDWAAPASASLSISLLSAVAVQVVPSQDCETGVEHIES
jgi:hypothetical protein